MNLTGTDPRQIGPYQVVRRLGAGGMGVVYLAYDSSEQFVAVKVMNPDWVEQSDFRTRFEREVEAIQRVAPFCTAPVLDAGIDGDLAYIVTEYVEGRTLWQTVQEDGPLRGTRLESVAVGMAVALTAIHRAGIVHRDLKPGNVILSPEGAKVIDFGIARLSGAAPITVGVTLGTPQFMSPEQAQGHPVTHSSDVFSWGSVVAFAGTGKPPFGGSTTGEAIYRLVHEDPELTGLPEPLRTLVERALDKRPEQRPAARHLIDELVGGPVGTLQTPGALPPEVPAPEFLPPGETQPPRGTRLDEPADEPTDEPTEAPTEVRPPPISPAGPVPAETGPEAPPEPPTPTRPGLRRRALITLLLAGMIPLGAAAGAGVYFWTQGGPGNTANGQKTAGTPSLDDGFDSERGWTTGPNQFGKAAREQSAYVITMVKPGGLAITAPVEADKIGNVTVRTTAVQRSGNGSYGVWCAGTPVDKAERRYDFYVSHSSASEGEGAVLIVRQDGQQRKTLKSMSSAAVNTFSANTIEARCLFGNGETRLRLLVNKIEVASVTDKATGASRPYGAGAVGVAVQASSAAEFAFEDFSAQKATG